MLTPKKFQSQILKWFDTHGRKDLPWQHHKTPYRVWLSEVMLQQTQVATVIPYFLRFIEALPTVADLARASEDTVLHLWTGLGYYSRARNLHRAAKMIQENYQGEFPSTLSELASLPGIGRSTAGAILAIAFEKKATILDGNVRRVLTRYFAVTEWYQEKKVIDRLWQLSENFTPQKRVADYTQAMMDMGATLCIRGKPRCNVCPLEDSCAARAQGIEKTLPKSKPRKALPIRQASLLIVQHDHFILLEKRASKGIWGGLWSFPALFEHATLSDIKKQYQSFFSIKKIQKADIFRHTFTHFHLDILPIFITLKQKCEEEKNQIWYNLREPSPVGLPAPVQSLIRALP